MNHRLYSWVLPRPQSLRATETGLPAVLGEITLFKQMECEHGLPYANKPHLISSLPVVQLKMSPPPEGGEDMKNVREPQVLSVIWAYWVASQQCFVKHPKNEIQEDSWLPGRGV